MKQDNLLLIISDGLNDKQSEFINTFVKEFEFTPEYAMFKTEDLPSEMDSFQLTKEKAEKYELDFNKKPHFLFAVEHGSYIIPHVVEDYGIQNVIHIDHYGERFAY